jgi:phage recombination protein Bet
VPLLVLSISFTFKVYMSNIALTQAKKLGDLFGVHGEGQELLTTLKATVFKGQVSEAQMGALLIVAAQYGLNPFTKEIYAFPDKQNGIVPVVGVDGWSRIINSRPEFDGMDFQQDADSCTCTIYRKDRSHPIKVTEWMAECKRSAGPWLSHPYRMLRHKAMIQCARLAFGFSGIYDEDEAKRIEEAHSVKQVNPDTGEVEFLKFDVVAALNAVESCETLDQLQATWKAEGAKAVAAKDQGGHAALKDAVRVKKSTLETVIDVDMKEAA